jgi:hypothetical protein
MKKHLLFSKKEVVWEPRHGKLLAITFGGELLYRTGEYIKINKPNPQLPLTWERRDIPDLTQQKAENELIPEHFCYQGTLSSQYESKLGQKPKNTETEGQEQNERFNTSEIL